MTSEVQQQVKGQLSGALDQWDKVQGLLMDPNNLIVVFLFAFGLMLKKSKHVPDWVIIFLVPGIGMVCGIGLFHVVSHQLPGLTSAMLGFVYGVAAVFAHGCIAQVLKSPFGATLMKIPLVPILAGLMDVEMDPPKCTPPAPKP